ncbi:NAD-glutamate dehydrogenase [Nocardia mangyaensis]|uniref:NAD-glutamate dehydrogenase n=1 Tax=Nocardia mangyaensis TaxID=2213200 RepID=UPI0026772EC6|nr:NAD-glutamate dehydrogenase [Nocardia mangyaensis]MDO3648254.1 NAD-glutamate dehydrogenase [Nocardia mangyaensis]
MRPTQHRSTTTPTSNTDPRARTEIADVLLDDPTSLQMAYFRQVRSGAALLSSDESEHIFRRHVALATTRTDGTATTRVYHPDEPNGIGPAVQVVNTDMPLLVESLVSTLRRLGATVIHVIHPIFDVVRDPDGRLVSLALHDGDSTAGHPDSGTIRESWIHIQLGAATENTVLATIGAALPPLLIDLRHIADSAVAMQRRQSHLADQVRSAAPPYSRTDPAEASECARLLRWLADDRFVLLGYARYTIAAAADPADPTAMRPVPDTGLGLLRVGSATTIGIPEPAADRGLLRLARGSAESAAPGWIDPYLVGIAEYDSDGQVVGEQLFVGTFTVTALHENILDIPVIEHRVRQVLEWAGFELNSFSGRSMLEVMQSFPRAELFSSDTRRLFDTTSAVLTLGQRRQVRLFLRHDPRNKTVSCLVYLPTDRYNTAVRLRMQHILLAAFDGEHIAYSARATESELANIYFTVHRSKPAGPADLSEARRQHLQDLLYATTHTWADRLVAEAATTAAVNSTTAKRYADSFPDGYKESFTPRHALADVQRLEQLGDDAIDMHLSRAADAAIGDWQFTLYVSGASVSLSRVLPILRSLGVEVHDEQPYPIELPDARPRWIYRFNLRAPRDLLDGAIDGAIDAALTTAEAPSAVVSDVQRRFSEAFAAMWYGRADTDGLNELVLRSGLHWYEVTVLRAYAAYLRQAGFAYSQSNITRVLLQQPGAARAFVELFGAYFDPDRSDPARVASIESELRALIDAVTSLDADRVLRAFLGLIGATLRTNYYMTGSPAVEQSRTPVSREYLAIKFAPQQIDELPKPKPQYEIYVYSPRVEGVHLRFGAVARGGLRWSDRREDFRTEILGLAKAQAVKNAVIVPVGAKGGFVVKNPPATFGDPAADRLALRDEGVACYRTFISGLLDLTDNIDNRTGAVLAPGRVIRRDSDDTYLVVAADKGTATFSDIANDVARRYDFWLGDAFASGGSVGYDHKAMGITAKGAWESVKRHFREFDIDVGTEPFTVAGIGDMSGDVFGNGMLLSEHIRLVAAFDHRHIFLDPDPDAARSFAERKRMFALPRSSWADYDAELISPGGGVWDRTAKRIPISPQARTALGLDDAVTELSPPEVVRAILLAPVDLLWNGGIGTYIKSSDETDAEVGDKSNDLVRVNGNQLRAKVIGEGGNLGATALGRIEFSRSGGKINTDALDNSAGVDCSDHEVNIKILLDRVVATGELDAGERDRLLASMTEEVSDLVLGDNIAQNFLMGLSRSDAAQTLDLHQRTIQALETGHGLDRDLEALPPDTELTRRGSEGRGLTSPELATLMAQVKLAIKADLLAGTLPDDPVFAERLHAYFPTPLRKRFGAAIDGHPLRRQIVATVLANEVVDFGGITYAFRQSEEAGADTADAVRAFGATVQIFDLHELWDRIRSAEMPTAARDALELETKRTLDRASRWLLGNRPQPLDITAEVDRYASGVRALVPTVPDRLGDDHRADLTTRSRIAIDLGAPAALADEVCRLIYLFPLLDVVDIAEITHRDGAEVAEIHYVLDDHLGIEELLNAVRRLERGGRWSSLARLAVSDDTYAALRSLTISVLDITGPDESAAEKLTYWESTHRSRIARARSMLDEIHTGRGHDLATLSVAARQIRSMASGPAEFERRT